MKCLYCGNEHAEGYYEDWRGIHACDSCISQRRGIVCSSCHGFCGDDASRVSAHHFICRQCRRNLITKADSEYVTNFVRNYFRDMTPIGEIRHWALLVAGKEQLQQLISASESGLLGFSRHEMDTDEYSVYIYRHLSRVGFANVLAHELLHIWQWQRNLNPPKHICEGFCQLGSYLILKEIGNREAEANINNMIHHHSPVYCEGLRTMIRTLSSQGWEGVMHLLTRC